MDGEFYIVEIWYASSESNYAFGPFVNDDAAESFGLSSGRDFTITVVNSPDLRGTGLEVS